MLIYIYRTSYDILDYYLVPLMYAINIQNQLVVPYS